MIYASTIVKKFMNNSNQSTDQLISSATVHKPVLLNEVLQTLDPQPGEFFIDGTVDGGGYAEAILNKLADSGKFLGVDWDSKSLERNRLKLTNFEIRGIKISLANDNFANLPQILRNDNLGLADGLVLDLGISSDQLESSRRGFSFSKDEPLLMTLNDASRPVKEILKTLSVAELTEIIKNFSQERYADKIAKAIKVQQRVKPIETTDALVKVIIAAVPKNYEHGRIHPATRTFMALRMYANKELENIQAVLENLQSILKPGGRAAIVTFHSGEDRLVKNQLRNLARDNLITIMTKKPIAPMREEILTNPRSRSAKLRAFKLALARN